jgi:hypothetical protein
MALSRLWTAGAFFKHIAAELQVENVIAYAQRLEILNQVQAMVADQLYNALWSSYMTMVVIVPDTAGRYSTAATGSFTVASSTLSVPTITFAGTDVGKLVMFRVSGNVYVAYITAVLSTTDVTLNGSLLPVVDVVASIDEVLVAGSVPTMNSISLATLKIMRTGEQMRLQLYSSQTNNVIPVSAEDVRVFIPSAPQNLGKIVWSFVGEDIIFAYGNGLTTPGTLSVRYPRIPIPIQSDADYLDLPDGIATQIATLVTKKIISERYGNTPQNFAQEMGTLIGEMYKNTGAMATQEEVKSKVQALS